jgi:hypothetical protein
VLLAAIVKPSRVSSSAVMPLRQLADVPVLLTELEADPAPGKARSRFAALIT